MAQPLDREMLAQVARIHVHTRRMVNDVMTGGIIGKVTKVIDDTEVELQMKRDGS